MIALFAPSLDRARRMSRRLGNPTAEVDGPFRLFRGTLGGAEARVFAVEGNADAAWAAARIAQRRGARLLVPLVECIALQSDELGDEPGACLPVAGAWDGAAVAPLLRLLPETADMMPMELAPLLPGAPLLALDRSGPALITLPWATRNRALLRALRARLGVIGIDLQLAGYAAAVLDACDPAPGLAPLAAVAELLAPRGVVLRATNLAWESSLDEALDTVLQQLDDALT